MVYSTEAPVDATTTGLTVRMHYNSSALTPDMTEIANSAFAGATIQDTEDSNDLDNDDTTDRYVNFLWFDAEGNFGAGESFPLTVFNASFATTAGFNGTTVRFTSTPANGDNFKRHG